LNQNYQRVKGYLLEHPDASAREIKKALGNISVTTANNWKNRVKKELAG
jgi:transposase